MKPKPALGDPEVDHPNHYCRNGVEALDVIDAFGLGFADGNALKYLLRAKFKGQEVRDIKKAIFYLTHHLRRIEGGPR